MKCASAETHSGRVSKSRTNMKRLANKRSTNHRMSATVQHMQDDILERDHFHHRNPPRDYVFVPKGDVYITRNCRSLTKESGKVVYQVYHPISSLPLGLHVPKHILQIVQDKAAATASSRREAIYTKDSRDVAKARAILKKRYPSIPSDDAERVLAHAFQKGSGRVGRTTRQTPERKMSLAVGAHLRHVHTAYDRLLRQNKSREEARDAVWEDVKKMKLEWKRR